MKQDRGTKIPVDCEDIASLLLPRDLVEERARLVSEGFPGWTRNHFYGFVDGMAIYGRARLELVAPLVRETERLYTRLGKRSDRA